MVKHLPTWYTPIRLKRYLLLFLGFWIAMLCASAYWNLHHEILDEKFMERHEQGVIICSHALVLLLGALGMAIVYYAIKKQLDARRQAYELYAWLSAIVESSSDAIFGLSASLKIESSNYAAQSFLGLSEQEMNGRNVEMIFSPEARDRVIARIRGVLGGKSMVNQEVVLVRKDGTPLSVAMTVSCLGRVEGEAMGFSIIARDTTEQKASEGRLRQAEKMEAVALFSAGLAHNFRNLLNSIMGHAQMLQLESKEDAMVRGHAERIVYSVKRSMELMNALLSFTRKADAKPVSVDLHEVIKSGLLLAEGLPGWNDKVKATMQLLATRHMVKGNKAELEHVLLNLLGNALDAVEDGGEVVLATENVMVDETYRKAHDRQFIPGEYVLVTLRDTGSGMDLSTASRVFEPFYTTKQKGTGLGLVTAQQTIVNMNGRIMVESEPGTGTTFRVYLPV